MTTTKIDLQKLRKHLAHHMKTTHQVTTILTNAGLTEPELSQIINALTQEKYLNDAEYVAEYIRTDRAKNKHTSAEKIKHTLTHQYGIDPTTVEDVLSEMGAYNENLPQAIKHAEKIISKAIKPNNIETLNTQKLTIRISRQLAARGYDEDTIQSAIYQACTNLLTDIE